MGKSFTSITRGPQGVTATSTPHNSSPQARPHVRAMSLSSASSATGSDPLGDVTIAGPDPWKLTGEGLRTAHTFEPMP